MPEKKKSYSEKQKRLFSSDKLKPSQKEGKNREEKWGRES